ncbi:hypothetical protein GCM10020001_115260 [Nonomuraea salmonea]
MACGPTKTWSPTSTGWSPATADPRRTAFSQITAASPTSIRDPSASSTAPYITRALGPHPDVTDERGRRGDVGGGMDLRLTPAVPDADSLRFSDHQRILLCRAGTMLAAFGRLVRSASHA